MVHHSGPQGQQDPARLLDAALDYARRGWSVIPVIGKRPPPRLAWTDYQTHRPDERTLTGMFKRQGITGLAVLLGSASGGLVCRDFDHMDTYNAWAASNLELATTLPTVATSRGRHVYFRGPEHFQDFGDGEYRGTAGHYCLLPPSMHPDGPLYTWLIPLPAGELPAIDPCKAGLLGCATERTERAERTERTECDRENRRELRRTEAMEGDAVEAAINSTLPTTPGQRYRKLFLLARKLKAIPALENADPRTLRPILVEWHKRALPVILTKPFSESWADFILAWPNVKYPAGQGRIEEAFRRATESAPPQEAAALYNEPPILRLAALCRELQRIAGDAPFYLDCRTAGRLLDVPHTTAWRWFAVLCADGVLVEVEKGSQASHKASRFRYVGG